MSTTTIGSATEARPANDSPIWLQSVANTAERRARTLAPTVYCPPTRVEECLEQSQAIKAT